MKKVWLYLGLLFGMMVVWAQFSPRALNLPRVPSQTGENMVDIATRETVPTIEGVVLNRARGPYPDNTWVPGEGLFLNGEPAIPEEELHRVDRIIFNEIKDSPDGLLTGWPPEYFRKISRNAHRRQSEGRSGNSLKEGELVCYPDPSLRHVSSTVIEITDQTVELIMAMEKLLEDTGGLGISAPQLGVNERIIVFGSRPRRYSIINPRITYFKGSALEYESCLSLPGLWGEVWRASEIVVEGVDAKGQAVEYVFSGIYAGTFQHELDHLDGILFIDRAYSLYKKSEFPVGKSPLKNSIPLASRNTLSD